MGDASARPVISEKAHAECVRLLDLLINKRVQESWSWVFMSPVTGIPGYHDIIKKPMDLGTVKKNLGSKPSRCRFKSHEKFAKDVRLVFQNALIYNKEDEQVKGSVFDAAQHLLRVFENAYAKAIETVFADEDDGADHNSSTNEEQDATATVSTSANGASSDKEKSRHSHSSRSSSSATPGHSHSSHSHASSDHESSSKHKKDKSSKKEKKSKKSKKKSKDKDKERSSSSSSKDRDKDKDRERKSSVSGTSESHKKSHTAAVGSSSSREDSGTHKTASNGTHSHDRPASAPRSTETATASASSSKATATSSSSSSSKSAAVGGGGKMPEETMNACLGVLMKLIKYKEGNVSPAAPFLQPVDLMHFPDYKIKVPNRMHLYGVQKKLRSGGYATMDTFAYDVRLVFSNCLVYNSDVVLSKVIRSHAVTLIKLFEAQFAKIGGSWPGVSDRWKCHQIIHEILADRTDGLETAQWFKYPIETYFDSADQVPYGYFKTIKHPMDLGTVSSKLHLGIYRHVSELMQDLQLIFDNCIKYWSRDAHGMAYCESAKKLITLLKTQSSIVFGSNGDKAKDKVSKSSSSASSSAGAAASSSTSSTSTKDRKGSSSSTSGAVATASSSTPNDEERSRKRKHTSSNFPQKEVCMEILKALRQHKMKGYHDIEILTAGPFMHAVDVTKYPDYLKIVSEPMDLAKIERKLKGDRYSDVNEFSADVHLIFSNCHKYNSDPIEGADIRAMASNLRDYFADLYNEKLGNGEKSRSSASAVATLPSAKLEASRSEPAPKQAVSLVVAKKPPLAASTKPLAPASSSAPTKREQENVTKAIAAAKSGTSSTSASSSTSTAVPASVSSSSSVSASKSSTSQMTPHELEEYKKRKKEKKEKKEKKDKKKKDKKEKKKKDKDKKDKKDRDKSSHSRAEARDGAALSSTSSTVPASAAPSSGSGVTASSKPSSTSLAPPSAATAAASHAARPSHVASKISPAETSSASASSKSKTKKSKKSELSGWEALAERVLNRLVKIEQVTKLHFDRPLLEVFPELAQDYRRLVQEPMDLKTLREKLHDHSLTSAADFTRLGRLIFQNAIKFNCAPDPASAHVRDMSAHLQWYFESLCLELKLGGSSDDEASKLDDRRRQRAERVNKTPMESKAKECQKLLRVLNSQKYDKNCWPFRKPVQVLFPTLPAEYYEIIKTPMDLATISEKLTASEYKVHGEFIRDVRLTFENAIRYNHADKDRDGWNVYSAATQMLIVVEEQWCDVTLEVMERVRRREIVRKERERLGEKRKGEKRSDGDDRKATSVTHTRPASALTVDSGLFKPKTSASTSEKFDSSVIAKASVVIAPPSSKDDPESSTKLRLQIVNRPLDRMNKSERKAEEKRRKRARREEEMARSEKRRKTAVAATDDALREAEVRSRRRIQKMEIAEAVRQREERERQQREEDAAKSLAVKMKFNAASWTGQLASGNSFWLRKPTKLQVPSVFGAAVDSY